MLKQCPIYCKGCMQKKEPTAYEHQRNSHICKFKYNGTAGRKETEGVKRVFTRSIDKHKVRFVEYLDDGDKI